VSDVYLECLHGSRIIRRLRAVRPTKLPQNLIGHGLHAPAVRGNGDVGDLGIQDRPSQHELLELYFRIRTVQQGAVPGMRAYVRSVGRWRSVDRPPRRVRRERAGCRGRSRAAAGGQNDGIQAGQAVDGLALRILNPASPSFSKMKEISTPVLASISASLSRNVKRNILARCRPTAVFPGPMGPMRKMFLMAGMRDES